MFIEDIAESNKCKEGFRAIPQVRDARVSRKGAIRLVRDAKAQ
jgi:hypothetical protein